MSLCFSTDGPEFPNAFVDSLLAGDVFFLCGAGVSAPQLPDFGRLVESTCVALSVERTDSEENAFDKGLFEEVLGSLSRRLSDPSAVMRTVSELLAVPDHPNLSQHRTIVRLSRDLDNRISVVTTNFDTLLERAAAEVMPSETARDISFAGQALPAPGSPSFSGIIHIHGRLADISLGLERTPLVLMSADYGDAYMAQNQSSRHGPPSGGPDFQRPSNRAPATRVGVSKSLLGRCLCGFEASRTRRASTTSARRDRARPGVVSCSRFSSGATRNGEMRRQIGW